jgi:hypothetical protein
MLYGIACKSVEEAILAFAKTKDVAYAFSAYRHWRAAGSFRAAALASVDAEQQRLAESVISFGGVPEKSDVREFLEARFLQLERAVFQVLDEISEEHQGPSSSAAVEVSRNDVLQMVSMEAGRFWKSGATKADLIKAVAMRLGKTVANVRKLLDEALGKPAAVDRGLTGSLDDVFAALKATKRERSRTQGPAKAAQTRRPHPWKEPKG